MLPWALGFAGALYGATAVVCGAIFFALALRVSRGLGADRQAAHQLFVFSISYLFLLFAALLTDRGGDLWSPTASPRDARPAGSAQVAPSVLPIRTASCFSLMANEV